MSIAPHGINFANKGVEKLMFSLQRGDCLDLMPRLPDHSIDLILCDLPYGVTQNKEDVRIPFDLLWAQYTRLIKDRGVIALFGQGLFYVDLVDSNRKLFRYDLIWDKVLKTGFLNANRMPLRQHEQIAIFYKRLPFYHPQFTEGEPLHGKGTAYKNKAGKNQNYGQFNQTEDNRKGSTKKYPASILRVPKSHPSAALHRTEKPVPLLEWIILSYTDEGATVLDNCMGSGSTGVACVNTKRNFIGMEKSPTIFAAAQRRIFCAAG